MSYPDSEFRSSANGEGLRLPPHSVEAEQAVLGGLMLDASAWDGVAEVRPFGAMQKTIVEGVY